MPLTSASLLDRLKVAPPESPDWSRLRDIYVPLIERWLLRVGVPRDSIDDLTQEILLVVIRQLPKFDRQRCGSFRAWLRQIAVLLAKNFFRKKARHRDATAFKDRQSLSQLEDPTSELSREWDRDHDRYVWARLQEIVRPDFEVRTWEAFRKTVIEGKPTKEVAGETGLTVNAVLLAKWRVLKRLRSESRGFID
jgi:RNA polymerase sigma-70 factor, ECF subfamily